MSSDWFAIYVEVYQVELEIHCAGEKTTATLSASISQ